MKNVLFLTAVLLIVVACGGMPGNSAPPLQERITGKWSGLITNKNGDKVAVEWQFLEGGTMVVKAAMINISYGGTWSVEGNRLNFTTEMNPDEKNYRDVEFVSDDVVKLTKEGITETFTRIEE